jgi:hypothetical protein
MRLIWSLVLATASIANAANLISVDWTASGTAPISTSSGTLNGFGNISLTTSANANAGAVFPISYNYSWQGGNNLSVGEGVALGVGASTSATQVITFTQTISNPYLLINWTDSGTSFDFGSNTFSMVGSSNATNSGNLITIGAGAANLAADGFMIRFNDTFGPTKSLSFVYNSNLTQAESVAMTLAVLPEPSVLSLLAVGLGVVLRRRRRTV